MEIEVTQADYDFAPIWDESILLAEHEAVQASVAVGGWLSAALDDPNVCDAMKADINRWFSAGFLYLDEVRKLMQTEREALEAENERLRGALGLIIENESPDTGYGNSSAKIARAALGDWKSGAGDLGGDHVR